jgi:hypothetical protein
MISHVYGGSNYLTVTSNIGSNPYISPSQPMTGMVRFNGSANGMEVYDGNGWQRVGGGTAHIDLSYEAQEILNWAAKRMADEKAYKELAEKYNAVKLALDNLAEAERQLIITATLAKETDEITS